MKNKKIKFDINFYNQKENELYVIFEKYVQLCADEGVPVQSIIDRWVNSDVAITPLKILEICCNTVGVNINLVVSAYRDRELIKARHLYCFVMREWYKKNINKKISFAKIGVLVNLSHCAVMHAVKTAKSDIEADKFYHEHHDEIMKKVIALHEKSKNK